MGFYIKRVNVSIDNDTTYLGQKFRIGRTARPYSTKSSAESAMNSQKAEDKRLCGTDIVFKYELVNDRGHQGILF